MDKQGTRILIGCSICSLIIMVLLFLAFRLAQPSCQLIFIEPHQLRSSGLANFVKDKPSRSHDKSLLLKLSAHLEYNVASGSSQEHNSVALPGQQVQADGGQLGAGQAQPSQATNNQQLIRQQPAQPISPWGPQQGNTNNVGPAGVVANNWTDTDGQVNQSAVATSGANREAKFLPLKVEDLEMRRVGEDKFKYSVMFNCSSMSMTLVRRSDRVYVEQASIELRPASKRKTSCELKLPPVGAFGAEVNKDGWAHYYCDKPITYSCYYYSSKQTYEPAQLLAELHIHGIEFETGTNTSNAHHKSHDFLSPRGRSLDC